MNTLTITNLKNRLLRRKSAALPTAIAAAAGLAIAAPASGQYYNDVYEQQYETDGEYYQYNDDFNGYYGYDDNYNNGYNANYYNTQYDNGYYDDEYGEAYEWEPDTGWHEEEWYDPTDWFDDDYNYGNTYDYEETDNYYDDGSYNNDYSYWNDNLGSDWYTDENDPADYDYWDSRRDYDYGTYYGSNNRSNYGSTYGTDWDYYTDEDDPVDYDYWDSRYDYDYRANNNRNTWQNNQNNMRQNQQRADRNQRNWQQNQQRNQRVQQAQLQGQLESWQRKNLDGQRDAHTLVRMRLQNGNSAIVNLGPNVDLNRLNLDRGDRIVVDGRRGSIDGRTVLMAQRVRAGDRTVRMNNWEPDQRQARNQSRYDRSQMQRGDQARSNNKAQTQGYVEAWQRVNLRGQPDAHTVLRVRLQDGNAKLINLGPNVSVSRLNLDRGDRIMVQGERGSINGRVVLAAEKVRLDNRTIRMNNWDQTMSRNSDRNNANR